MNIDSNFFKIKHKNIAPKSGSILVSEPFSKDAYFKRSVVLITLNNEEGAIGFILNKFVKISFKELIGENIEFNANVSIGGPVSIDRIDFLHTIGEKIPNSKKIVDNIYWGGDFSFLLELIKSNLIKDNQVRFFIGYSGWGKNQLKTEIENDYWIVTNSDSKTIMQTDKNYWQSTLQRLGDNYKAWFNLPEDPSLN
ncbi:MAG: YqgE/AlgH family protein [Bacteroidales bacterium]|nr:YqgE/AlgH family protein [Bacteroidales bacterium]